MPSRTERVQCIPIQLAVAHDVCEAKEESCGIQPWQDLDELARRLIGYIDKCMHRPAGRGDHITLVGGEAATVDLEEVATFQNIEDFGLAMPVQGWAETWGVGRLYRGQRTAGCIGRHTHAQIEPNRGDQDWRFLTHGVMEGEGHKVPPKILQARNGSGAECQPHHRSSEVPMPDVNLPLSGAVTQSINPWTAYFTAMGSQIGLINVNVGSSSDPKIEKDVLARVASYGKQLGRIGDAVQVLLKHFHPAGELSPHDCRAIDDLKLMLAEIANVKHDHGASFVVSPSGPSS